MNQFVVAVVEGGHRVYVRNTLSYLELNGRIAHMLQMGWSQDEIDREITSMQQAQDKTEGPPQEFEISADFVLSNIEPGDVVYVPGNRLPVRRLPGQGVVEGPTSGFLVQQVGYA